MTQRRQEIVVHCEYTEHGEELRQILIGVFRIFLSRNIRPWKGRDSYGNP